MKKWAGFLISVLVFICSSKSVYAGDINNAEQRIIRYMNRIFNYNGVKYVATEEAKQKAIDRLMRDDYDLTSAEVDNYILQASRNIYKGIQEGYLVEYIEETEPTTTEYPTERETTQATIEPTEKETTEKTTTETSTEETETTTTVRPTERETTQTTIESTEKETTEKAIEGITESETSETIEIPTKVEPNTLLKDLLGSTKCKIYDSDGNELTIGTLEPYKWPLTIEEYDKGIVYSIDSEGNVLYYTTLPVKNTGYSNRSIVISAVVAIAGLILLCVITVFTRKKNYYYIILTVGIIIIGILTVVIGGKEYISKGVAKWKSIWITGAPRYEYNDKNDSHDYRNPVVGSQYGEIVCDRIGLRAPLYYGDTDNILEKGTGTWIGSSLPGQPGSALIGGHDTTYFAALENIAEEDIVEIMTSYGKFRYRVTGTLVAGAEDTFAYDMSADMDEIILYTCYPFGNHKDDGQRFYVYAEKINDEKEGA